MTDKMRHALDKMLSKVASRKLMVWGVATGLAILGTVTSEDWVAVSLVYIGSQGAVDLAAAWRHGQ
tara:strand:- start:288 stop:485 length:198 start_codon:yes stop_codon:yes gene_type:complete